MAEEIEEKEKETTRDIRLIDGLDSGTYGIGTVHISAEAGKVYPVSVNDARALVAGGFFEYSEKAETDGYDLAVNFPQRAALIKNGFDSMQKIMDATDEDILKIDGIGPKTLAEIRAAATEEK